MKKTVVHICKEDSNNVENQLVVSVYEDYSRVDIYGIGHYIKMFDTEDEAWSYVDRYALGRKSYKEDVLKSFTADEIRGIFDNFKEKHGWKGLAAEDAIECFIRFVGKDC